MQRGNFQLGRTEPCPCGSGKRYMDCCLNTKYLVNYNYKDQAVMLDKKEAFKNFKKIMGINKWLNKLKSPSAEKVEITIDDGLKMLDKTYSLLDNTLKEINQFTPCTKGCSKCCNSKVEISYIEAEHIKRYIENEFTGEQGKELKKRLEDNKKDNKCIFLSEEDECTIYGVRPIGCRTHIVFSHPETCVPENNDRPIEYSDATLSVTENTVRKISKLYDTEEVKHTKKGIKKWF